MHNSKTPNQLYLAALKRGYKGNFSSFCELINSQKTELLSKEDVSRGNEFLNDRGQNQVEINNEAPRMQSMVQEQPHFVRDNGNPPPAEVQDKIMGMSKPVFFGVLALLILVIGISAFFVYRNMSSSKMTAMPGSTGPDNAAAK